MAIIDRFVKEKSEGNGKCSSKYHSVHLKEPALNPLYYVCRYVKDSVEVLLTHYNTEKPAETLSGEECTIEAII